MTTPPSSHAISHSYAISAYAAVRPTPSVPSSRLTPGIPAAHDRALTDHVELFTRSAARQSMRERVDRIVAATVDVVPFTELPAKPVSSDPNILPMYRHPADKNAAAVRLQGNRLDVQA